MNFVTHEMWIDYYANCLSHTGTRAVICFHGHRKNTNASMNFVTHEMWIDYNANCLSHTGGYLLSWTPEK